MDEGTEEVKPRRRAKASGTAQATDPAAPKTTRKARAAKPAEATPEVEPVPPVQRAKPVKKAAAKNAGPAKNTEPTQDAGPAKGTTPAKATGPAETTTPAANTRPAKDAAPAKETGRVRAARPAKDKGPAKDAAPVKATPPAKKAGARTGAAKAAAASTAPAAEVTTPIRPRKAAGTAKAGTAKKAPARSPQEPLPLPFVEHERAEEAATTTEAVKAQEAEPAKPPEVESPLWARMVADPGYAPEHAAQAAIDRLGTEAREWATAMRNRYPTAPPDRLARLAAKELTSTARGQAMAGAVPGPLGLLTGAAGLAHTQIRLVLHIAAIYGHDPAAEGVLRLLRVPRLTEPTGSVFRDASRLAGGYALRRAAMLVPWAGAAIGAWVGGRTLDRLAERAIELYSARPPAPTTRRGRPRIGTTPPRQTVSR